MNKTAGALLVEDAVNTFPDECCGFLFGTEDEEENRTISEILVVDNAKEGDKTRRFEISPLDYLKAEQFAIDQQFITAWNISFASKTSCYSVRD